MKHSNARGIPRPHQFPEMELPCAANRESRKYNLNERSDNLKPAFRNAL
jgi:hypothetical protein